MFTLIRNTTIETPEGTNTASPGYSSVNAGVQALAAFPLSNA